MSQEQTKRLDEVKIQLGGYNNRSPLSYKDSLSRLSEAID